MTKLEKKLIELGYERGYHNMYHKNFSRIFILTIEVYKKVIFGRVYSECREFSSQDKIDDLQLAFNQLQNDLEVLKKYENNN